MSDRICILADVRHVTGDPNSQELIVYKVDVADGSPKTDDGPTHTEHFDRAQGFELWRCNNCGRERKTWDEMRQHLGKFNQLIDPFNYEEIADG